MKIVRFSDDRIGSLDKVGQVVDIIELISRRAEGGPQQVGPDDKRTKRRIIL